VLCIKDLILTTSPYAFPILLTASAIKESKSASSSSNSPDLSSMLSF
jgi:hypothetical protein